MKNHNEMYQSLLSRCAAYQEKKQKQRRTMRRIVPVTACFCLAAVLGIGYWRHFATLPEIPSQYIEPTETSATDEAAAALTDTMPVTDPVAAVTATDTPESLETLPEVTDTPEPSETLPTETDATEAASQRPTEPLQTDHQQAPQSPTEPKQTEPLTEQPTEPKPTEPPTEQLTEPEPEEPTGDPSPPNTQELDGFQVVHDNGRYFIVSTDPFPQPDGTLRQYTVEGWRIELLATWDEVTEDGKPIRYYKAAHYDREFIITQQEYEDFSIEIPYDNVSALFISNGIKGFELSDSEDTTTLYWFWEGEGFCMTGETYYISSMLKVIRSFKPID